MYVQVLSNTITEKEYEVFPCHATSTLVPMACVFVACRVSIFSSEVTVLMSSMEVQFCYPEPLDN